LVSEWEMNEINEDNTEKEEVLMRESQHNSKGYSDRCEEIYMLRTLLANEKARIEVKKEE
jgi:hypothetical protein